MIAQKELSPAEIKRIDGWVNKGVCKGLAWNGKGELTEYEHVTTDATGHEVFLESTIVEELRSQVWGRLYTNTPNSKAAYSFGLSAGRDYVRQNRKALIVSQMDLKAVGEDANDGESARNGDENPNVELLMPWDRVNTPVDLQVERIISEAEDDDRRDALEWLKDEYPADYIYLMDFARRKANHLGTTSKMRYRVRNIRLRMRKRTPDVFGRLRGAPRK